MSKIIKVVFLGFLLSIVSSCSTLAEKSQVAKKPQNIIIMIGDGMGHHI